MNQETSVTGKTIWAFDLGKGSIGEAVRCGNRFLHKASLLIPAEFAETKTAAGRRRMWRTRQAHKAREKWLDEVMREAGFQVLHGRNYDGTGKWKSSEPADERLEREFAEPGDPTCYTSCLLRIKLLRGERLEPWQIYKALHSAIQRRGYDPDIPWKTRNRRKVKPGEADDDDEAGTETRMQQFEKDLEVMSHGKIEYKFSCYFDAWKMGLWNPDKPNELKDHIDCHAESTRNQIVPRKLVDNEIRALTEAASKHYPKLKGQADFLLYGPAKTPYASFDAKLRKQYNLKEGSATDWQGVLGQKIPRFDNRIIGKCVLIPRMNVCKADVRLDKNDNPIPETLLASEVSFLMKLKNMRIQRGKRTEGLTAGEIKSIFESPDFQKMAITESAWKKKVCAQLGAFPLPGHGLVDAPKFSGRSRFCRPALDILKRLILSGTPPKEFHMAEVARLNGNKNPLKGLVEEDLRFLLKMGETWQGLYIPNQKLDALVRNADNTDEAIRTLIGSQNDPIVRHRLNLFVERLNELNERFGQPENVVLEFVREDFMGKKAKIEYNRFIKERAAERVKFRKEAEEAGATERAAGLKMELLRAQSGRCLYTTAALIPEELDEYVIDHIVPRAKGGPDAVINYVLTTKNANDDKADRTPYEWLFGKEGWDAYVSRVRERAGALRNKKVQLLTSPDAETLVQKYTALAETAWISKLAQALLDLRFGWQNGNDKAGIKRVIIVSGGLTGRIRRKYGLNRILNPDAEDEEEADQKNRDDDRHHALDAMVISFIPNWARDTKKTGFFKFPEGFNREFFAKEIAQVDPRNIALEKPAFEETFYGHRTIDGKDFIVGRESLGDLAAKFVANKRVLKARKDIDSRRIVSPTIRYAVESFLNATPNLTLETWDKWCADFRCGEGGPRVEKILMTKSKANSVEEYKDVSKDKTGQFRRGAKHRGYFVFERPAATKKEPNKMQIDVQPVYVFQSKLQIARILLKEPGVVLLGYFESGCLVRIPKEWEFQRTKYPAADYICTSIWTNRNAKLRHPRYGEIGPIGLRILFDAGLKRV